MKNATTTARGTKSCKYTDESAFLVDLEDDDDLVAVDGGAVAED